MRNRSARTLITLATLCATMLGALSLGGCVVEPAGYGYGYAPAPAVVVAPRPYYYGGYGYGYRRW